ncbi:MAG: hypothetical protein HKN87_00090 [Saprospiraceae bacterium]|nr:hypothetical protein [Saprospiraceae bacterium]
MSYIASIILVISTLSGLYLEALPPDLPNDVEPVIATFAVTLHVDRADNNPIYSETHQMNDLEQGFKIGEGMTRSGDLTDINWRNDLVFLRIARLEGEVREEVSLSVIKYTSEGVMFEQIPGATSDDFVFALDVQ